MATRRKGSGDSAHPVLGIVADLKQRAAHEQFLGLRIQSQELLKLADQRQFVVRQQCAVPLPVAYFLGDEFLNFFSFLCFGPQADLADQVLVGKLVRFWVILPLQQAQKPSTHEFLQDESQALLTHVKGDGQLTSRLDGFCPCEVTRSSSTAHANRRSSRPNRSSSSSTYFWRTPRAPPNRS